MCHGRGDIDVFDHGQLHPGLDPRSRGHEDGVHLRLGRKESMGTGVGFGFGDDKRIARCIQGKRVALFRCQQEVAHGFVIARLGQVIPCVISRLDDRRDPFCVSWKSLLTTSRSCDALVGSVR